MSSTQRLVVVLVLNLALVGGLVTVGLTAHSLAVLAAGSDYLLDAAGVGAALLAIRLSARPARPADSTPPARPVRRARPEGRPSATSVAALLNGGWLLILELLVAAAAVQRLTVGTTRVDGLPVLVVSAIAALVMAVAALILHGDATEDAGAGEAAQRDLSVAAVLLDTIADAAAAGGAAAAGAVILATRGWYWLDPAVALAIAVVVAYHALVLIRKVLGQLGEPADREPG